MKYKEIDEDNSGEMDFDEFIVQGADKYSSEIDYESDGQKLDENSRKCVSIDIDKNLNFENDINFTGENKKCIPRHFLNYIFNVNKIINLINMIKQLTNNEDKLQKLISNNESFINNKIISRKLIIEKDNRLIENSIKTVKVIVFGSGSHFMDWFI